MRGGRNSEGLPDPTATIAIGNVMRETKRNANRLVRQKERSSVDNPSDPEGKRHHKKRSGKDSPGNDAKGVGFSEKDQRGGK